MKFWYPPDKWKKNAPLFEGKTDEKLIDTKKASKEKKYEDGDKEKPSKSKKDKKQKKEKTKEKKTDKDKKKKKSSEEVKQIEPEPTEEREGSI